MRYLILSSKKNPLYEWEWNRKILNITIIVGKPRDANGDPQDRFFYLTFTLMMDPYILDQRVRILCLGCTYQIWPILEFRGW